MAVSGSLGIWASGQRGGGTDPSHPQIVKLYHNDEIGPLGDVLLLSATISVRLLSDEPVGCRR